MFLYTSKIQALNYTRKKVFTHLKSAKVEFNVNEYFKEVYKKPL